MGVADLPASMSSEHELLRRVNATREDFHTRETRRRPAGAQPPLGPIVVEAVDLRKV